jgi:hypothetical protein
LSLRDVLLKLTSAQADRYQPPVSSTHILPVFNPGEAGGRLWY